MHRSKFTDEALDDLRGLPKSARNALKREFKQKIHADPVGCSEPLVKPLSGPLEFFRSFHFRNYRVVYRVSVSPSLELGRVPKGVTTATCAKIKLNPDLKKGDFRTIRGFILSTRRHYENSPITEAVIDIRAEFASVPSLDSLASVQDRIKSDYPLRQDLMQVEGQFSLGPEVGAKATKIQLGFRFSSKDGRYILQARANGFTFSRLHPYENWDSLRDEARRMWDIYRGVTNPLRVTRVAVRYINRVDMPAPVAELSDYFRTFPEVSHEMPQMMNGYIMQLLIPVEDVGGTLSLIEASVPAPRPGVGSINLDIDLFTESSQFDSEDKMWDLLERFRHKKNEIFEGCITDKARELFGPIIKRGDDAGTSSHTNKSA